MRCRYIYDEKYGKVHIPGCYPAIHGPEFCTCYPKKNLFCFTCHYHNDLDTCQCKKAVTEESKLISELEKENARLNRIIKKLLKRK